MSRNIMQDLHTVGLNPFAVTLLAESLLKSPLAPMTVGKPQGFFFPVRREDCADWCGVRITVEAVPVDAPKVKEDAQAPVAEGVSSLTDARHPLGLEELLAIAQERPNEMFLKGTGVTKLIDEVHRLRDLCERFAASESGVSEPVDQPVGQVTLTAQPLMQMGLGRGVHAWQPEPKLEAVWLKPVKNGDLLYTRAGTDASPKVEAGEREPGASIRPPEGMVMASKSNIELVIKWLNGGCDPKQAANELRALIAVGLQGGAKT